MSSVSSHIVTRTGLLENLAAQPDIRIILISAPAGYGKSILASQVADWFGDETLYHSLTVWQRDIYRLSTTAIRTLQTQFPAIENSNTRNPEQAVAQLLEQIADIQQPLTYILDDIHHLVDAHRAEQWLQSWLDMLPSNVRLILCGRQLPPLNWSPFVQRGEILAYGIEQLTLAADEIRQLMPQLSTEKAEQLRAQFDGWAAGIRLSLMIQDGGQGLPAFHRDDPKTLFQELLQTTFQAQSPDFQSFLLLSSVLDTVTERGCEDALGMPDVEHHLSQLHTRQLFIRQTTDGIVYHELFRSFLQQRLKQRDRTAYQKLHRQVAEWHQTRDEIEQAIVHYVEADATGQAVELAEHVAQSYFLHNQEEALLRFYDMLPPQQSPQLALHCGYVHTDRRNFEQSNDALEQARHGFEGQKNPAMAIRAQLQIAFNAYRAGDYQEALNQAERFTTIAQPELQARCQRIQGLAYLETGYFDEAIARLKDAQDSLPHTESSYVRSLILQDLGEAYIRAGNLDEAGATLQEMVAIKRQLGNADDLALALNNLGHYWYRVGAYEDAIATLEDGLDMVSHPTVRATAYLYWSLANVYRAIGAYRDAERYYNAARRLSGMESHLYVGVHLSFAVMRGMQGYWHDADHILDHISDDDTTSLQHSQQRILRCATRAMLYGDDYQGIDDALRELHMRNAKLDLADYLGIYLHVGWQLGQTGMLRRGISILRHLNQELWMPVAVYILNIPQLREELTSRPGLNFLKQLCDRLETNQRQSGTSILQPGSYDLSIYTLGQNKVLLNGNQITDWTVTFAKELFLFLHFEGPKKRHELQETFWPQRDVSKAMSSFHTTRNRIRHALGEQAILYDSQQYMVNPAFSITTDCESFEEYARRASRLPLSDARAEDLLRRAHQLYQGAFLSDLTSEWVLYRREYFQDMYVSVLQGLAECCEMRADYAGAIHYYDRAIDLEPYTESLYRKIILCWGRIGRRDMMKRMYQKLVNQLQSGIQMNPSRRTQAFYQSLIDDLDS